MTKKMTLTEKLYAMRPAELIKYAENLGVKLPQDKAGKNLKCSREKAVTRVIEAEMAARNVKPVVDEEPAVEQPVAEVETASDGTPYVEVMAEIVAGAEKKSEQAKKERKPRKAAEKLSFEGLLACIPVYASNLVYKRLKGDRVGILSGGRRLLAVGVGRGGYRVITNKADLANMFSDCLGLTNNMTADGRDFVYTAITQEQMEQMVRTAVRL